eukprot:tig00000520_g1808.t1
MEAASSSRPADQPRPPVRDKHAQSCFWWGSRAKNCRTPGSTNLATAERDRLRDICIVACQELDRHERIPSALCMSDDLLANPRSHNEKMPFVQAIRDGKLSVLKGEDPWSAVRGFLRGIGAVPQDSWSRKPSTPGQLIGISRRRSGFQGRFIWHGREVSTPRFHTKEEAAEVRDRLIIICKFVEEKSGQQPRLRGDRMNYPRSDYEGDAFFLALQRGELGLASSAALSRADDHRDRVYSFLERHGGCTPRRKLKRASGCTNTRAGENEHADVQEEEEEEGEEDEDEDEGEEEEEEECGEQEKLEEEAEGARRVHVGASAAGFRGLELLSRNHFWRGTFRWRRATFTLTSSFDAEEAALCRDRAIICCQWLDEHDGVAPRDRILDAQLNFPRSVALPLLEGKDL